MPRSRGPGLRAVPGAGCRRHLLAVARALPRQVAVRPALGDLARGIAAAEAEGQGDRHCNRAEHQAEREVDDVVGHAHRSEEHTSELQSLMRISYAVFCLKKKNKHKLIRKRKI